GVRLSERAVDGLPQIARVVAVVDDDANQRIRHAPTDFTHAKPTMGLSLTYSKAFSQETLHFANRADDLRGEVVKLGASGRGLALNHRDRPRRTAEDSVVDG